MKIRLFLFFGVFLLVLTPTFFVKKDIFDTSIAQSPLTLISENIEAQKKYTISTQKPQNVWYLGFKKEAIADKKLCVRWESASQKARTCIDSDGIDDTGKYFTFPAFFPASDKITFQIENSNIALKSDKIILYSMNTKSVGTKYVFEPFSAKADPFIVSRAGWGADETLRYADSPDQAKNWKKEMDYITKDKTQKEISKIWLNRKRRNLVKKSGGKTTETQSIKYFENGHRLLWPIEKTRQKNQIVIHHTTQKFKGLSDDEMIRGVYRYHAVSRGWGDIGYNYIIGQNGKIYEGRAGGDYVVGAHALYNNKNSVGISVLGDYESVELNLEQKYALQDMISFVAKKYGITLRHRVAGWKKCLSKSCGILQKIYTYGLVGHGEVGYTTCPGENIKTYIPTWRRQLSTYRIPILNTLPADIEAEPADQKMNMRLKGANPLFPFGFGKNLQDKIVSPTKKILTPSSQKNIGPKPVVSRCNQISNPENNPANTLLNFGGKPMMRGPIALPQKREVKKCE